jgi:hypothetical protein
MPTLSFSIEQSDDGKILVLSDTTDWVSPYSSTDTLVTHVTINMSWNGTNNSTSVVNDSYTTPTPQTNLVWTIESGEFTNGSSAFVDGFYTFEYNATANGTAYQSEIIVLLDYNSKKYSYDLYMNAPYKLKDSLYYNKDVERCALSNVLLKGMQYNAAVNQTLRATDILQSIVRIANIPSTQTVL